MPQFSLIIPVYNTEKYLVECLDSCINQTFRDIEIICVNDCSQDNSRIILQDYAKQDHRIKVINHVENRKQGAARNTGVDAATGQYSWFIDSDDYILLNSCEIINDLIQKHHADIIHFNRIDYSYNIANGEKQILLQQPLTWKTEELYERKDYTKLPMPEISPCMFVSSMALTKRMKFRSGVLHEDNDYVPILFSEASKIYNSAISLYCVRRRGGSSTNGGTWGLSPQRTIDSILAVDSLYNYIISKNIPNEHFCMKTLFDLCSYAQHEYKKYPEIHSAALDAIIKNVNIKTTVPDSIQKKTVLRLRKIVKKLSIYINKKQ